MKSKSKKQKQCYLKVPVCSRTLRLFKEEAAKLRDHSNRSADKKMHEEILKGLVLAGDLLRHFGFFPNILALHDECQHVLLQRANECDPVAPLELPSGL